MTGTLAQGRLSAQNAEMSRAPRLFRLHLSLWLGLAVAVVVFLATPTDWRVTTRWAVGWDAGLVVYLVLTGWRILRIRSVDQIRARAAELDDAGAVVLPPNPGFYHHPESVADIVDFVVARILDQLAVPHALMQRWGA